MFVLECFIFQVKMCPKSKKQKKIFVIKINILDIEKLETKIWSSMHVPTNSNKICQSTLMNVGQQIWRQWNNK